MIRQIKCYFAIRGYTQQLAPELARRWGTQRFFSVEQVTDAALTAGLTTTFIAYAHALFCSRSDFEAHYGAIRVASGSCSYDGLRSVVARRYYRGVTDFDAASIIRATRRDDDGYFYESTKRSLISRPSAPPA